MAARRGGTRHTAAVGIAWRGPGRDRRRREEPSTVIDLDDRLAAYVPSTDRRSPDPDEVRAWFRHKLRAEPPPPAQDADSFATRYPTESLFTWATPTEPDTVIDLRDPVDAYRVLGLPAGAPWTDVVRAHRLLARRHHPDHHVGSPEDVRRKADVAIRNVNAAYELLQRRHQQATSIS